MASASNAHNTPPIPRPTVDLALALGGLAAHNYHGAGLLQAALEKGVTPGMISCTSGQIYWVWNYLLARAGKLKNQPHGAKDLRELASIHLTSGPRPSSASYFELLADVPTLYANYLHRAKPLDLTNLIPSAQTHFLEWVMSNMPARLLDPAVSDQLADEIAKDFNASVDIGICFNSYNPASGEEYVYLNDTAMALRHRHPGASTFRTKTKYQRIDGKAVLNGLWIYEYGFHESDFLDGAYFRQVMLSEVSRAKKIVVARPIRVQWKPPLPVSYGDKEVLKTEVFFNGSYYGEKSRIELVNRLIHGNALDAQFMRNEGYHKVKICEIAFSQASSYSSYLAESLEVFEHAYNDGCTKLP